MESSLSLASFISIQRGAKSVAAANPQNANRYITTLGIASHGREGYLKDLQGLAPKLGFNLVNLSPNDWPEDEYIPLQNGQALLPNTKTNILDRNELGLPRTLPLFPGYIKYKLENGTLMFRKQGVLLEKEDSLQFRASIQGTSSVKQAQSYLEGGNVLPIRNRDGSMSALVGEDSLQIAQIILEKQGYFTQDLVNKKLADMEFRQNFDTALMKTTEEKLSKAQILSGSMTQEEKDRIIKDYLVKQSLSKDVIAKDLGINTENVSYIYQKLPHIDLQMRPLNDNVVILDDESLGLKLVNGLLKRESLPPEERKGLIDAQSYLEEKIANGAVESTEKVRLQLEKAGYKVVLVPGSMHESINFMNGEAGTAIDGKRYYLTNSASAYPELEESFKKKVLKDTRIEELYFLGGKDAAKTLLSGGGLDCITTELLSNIREGFSLKDQGKY